MVGRVAEKVAETSAKALALWGMLHLWALRVKMPAEREKRARLVFQVSADGAIARYYRGDTRVAEGVGATLPEALARLLLPPERR